jgi:HlyD family secretion protein
MVALSLRVRPQFLSKRLFLALACVLLGCGSSRTDKAQGYIEGEYIYVSSPLAGTLESLYVQRGQIVKKGDKLFTLENGFEKAANDEIRHQLNQAQANLEDAKKGKRPSEIDSIKAQLKQAQSALTLSSKEFERQKKLMETSGATSQQDFDQAHAAFDQDEQRVMQLNADLKTAQLGSRTDQIVADEANVKALEAGLTQTEWSLSQKYQTAPEEGLIFDTLYREGEWIAAGKPIVALLPPQNIKARAFVSEKQLAQIHLGDSVQVFVDGLGEPLIGKVSFISPQAEYTPPVIYSEDSRAKLVFMIEIIFDPKTAIYLHPGQPVTVQLHHA